MKVKPPVSKHRNTYAFTLIELSIVLVIIGLIVGGVLVGKDLIQAAALRSTISQYTAFNTAANTFKLKYGGLPGDITNPANFFSGYPTTNGMAGDGNGVLMCFDSMATGAERSNPCWEILFFWYQLSLAKLIPDAINNYGYYPTVNTPTELFPAAKIGSNAYWIVGNNVSNNFYALASFAVIAGNAAYYDNLGTSPVFTPLEASSFDAKIDDGLPNTGSIQARGATRLINYNGWANTYIMKDLDGSSTAMPAAYAATPAAGTCTTGGASSSDTANVYATVSASGTTKACNMRLKFN